MADTFLPFSKPSINSDDISAVNEVLRSGWIWNDDVLEVKENFAFSYNSDVRGFHIFFQKVKNESLTISQIPVTLPTYDKIIGRHGKVAFQSTAMRTEPV